MARGVRLHLTSGSYLQNEPPTKADAFYGLRSVWKFLSQWRDIRVRLDIIVPRAVQPLA